MRANQGIVVTAPAHPLALVPYTRALVPTYHGWMEDAALREATASERLTLDQELAMCDAWATDEDKLTFIVTTTTREEGGRGPPRPHYTPVGDVNLFFNDADAPSVAEVEVMIALPTARRRGIASGAVALLLGYAAALPPPRALTRVVAKVGRANAASAALFGRLGFALEGGSDVFQEEWFGLDLASPAGSALLASVAGWRATAVGEFDGTWGG